MKKGLVVNSRVRMVPSAPPADETAGVLENLRLLVSELEKSGEDKRLPNERLLAERLGITRARLRKSLQILEDEGRLWRGVGRGTFIGPKPAESPDAALLASKSNPVQVMRARMAIEPELAGLAAVNATDDEIAQLKELSRRCKFASNWREYEVYDALFHHEIAVSAHNTILLALTDLLTQVRRSVTWGRPRPEGVRPPEVHHSFVEHDNIIDAISHREPIKAANAMRRHLQTVEDRLVGRA
jgi:DNA-binding FadR family transcriptional regulator